MEMLTLGIIFVVVAGSMAAYIKKAFKEGEGCHSCDGDCGGHKKC